MPDGAALIGIDWGTTAFRAFLLDPEGAILDRRSGPHGIMSVADRAFAATLSAQIGAWLAEARAPVLMSGMIGSRQGWVEAPYVATPAGLAELAAGLVSVPAEFADIRLVPGVASAAPMRDVMRGEETQVVGALATIGEGSGSFLLPGTHSKWVRVEGGRVVGFSTYMTGEIFAACRRHTILGRLMTEGGADPAAFIRGVEDGARPGGPGALLNRLFGVRTAGLFGEIAETGLEDYLSGLLIGAEMADAGSSFPGPLRIIASHALAERYRTAATALGLAAENVHADCIVRGYLAIAQSAGIVAASGASAWT